MTYEKFNQMATEEGIKDEVIPLIWNDRPTDDLDEDRLRDTFQWFVKQDQFKNFVKKEEGS